MFGICIFHVWEYWEENNGYESYRKCLKCGKTQYLIGGDPSAPGWVNNDSQDANIFHAVMNNKKNKKRKK
jgi:hypothetical protein